MPCLCSTNADLHLSPKGAALIKDFEGLVVHAAKCPEGVPTAGWGHTGKDVKLGETYSREQCDAWFSSDMSEHEGGVKSAVKVALSQGQFDALTSFSFNCGSGWITGKGHQQATFMTLLNSGNYSSVPAQILRFSHGANTGKDYAGLRRRRNAECDLWRDDEPVYAPAGVDNPQPQSVDPEQGNFAAHKSRTVFGAVTAWIGGLAMSVKEVFGLAPQVSQEAQHFKAPVDQLLQLMGSHLPHLGLLAVFVGFMIVVGARWDAAQNRKIG